MKINVHLLTMSTANTVSRSLSPREDSRAFREAATAPQVAHPLSTLLLYSCKSEWMLDPRLHSRVQDFCIKNAIPILDFRTGSISLSPAGD